MQPIPLQIQNVKGTGIRHFLFSTNLLTLAYWELGPHCRLPGPVFFALNLGTRGGRSYFVTDVTHNHRFLAGTVPEEKHAKL